MASRIYYATMAAGAVFIAIGIASSIYAYTPVRVPLDNVVAPGRIDIIKPDMNPSGRADITVTGSSYEVTITDPQGRQLAFERGNSTFSYDLTAQSAGIHQFLVNNTGSAELSITGHAETKSSPLGFTGALMLAVTGIIVIGLGLRFRRR